MTAPAVPSASASGTSAPGTARARERAVNVASTTIALSSATTTHRLSDSNTAWIT